MQEFSFHHPIPVGIAKLLPVIGDGDDMPEDMYSFLPACYHDAGIAQQGRMLLRVCGRTSFC